jgi:hypothetical protein
MKKLAILLLACLPLQASADVIQYNKCKVNAGKSFADVRAWLNDWRGLVKKEGIDYRIRLLQPHADSTVAITDFFLEGTTPTFESYGKAYTWWYGAPAAEASNAQLTAAATCDAGSVYRTAE